MRDRLKQMVPTLSRFRFLVQLLTFALSVYGGLLVGCYAAEKISTALPPLATSETIDNVPPPPGLPSGNATSNSYSPRS